MSLSPRTVLKYWDDPTWGGHPPGDAACALAYLVDELVDDLTLEQRGQIARVIQCALTATDEEYAKREARLLAGGRAD